MRPLDHRGRERLAADLTTKLAWLESLKGSILFYFEVQNKTEALRKKCEVHATSLLGCNKVLCFNLGERERVREKRIGLERLVCCQDEA